MYSSFWVAEPLKLASLGLIAWGSGPLVQYWNVKVNYTRKVNFFALYLVPLLVDQALPYEPTTAQAVLRPVGFMLLLLFFLKPVRERLRPAATMFLSYDRPEDRPYTMLWLTTQLVAGYAVLIPMTWVFRRLDRAVLLFIPVIVHGLGDGLAEPVGVRFGRHKYATRALFSSRRYTRSLEGSACVLVVGLVAVAAFHGSFSAPQLVVALLTVPILMTLAEACSPHTWDTPLMLLSGSLALLAIVTWV
jgi:dolichol kinase